MDFYRSGKKTLSILGVGAVLSLSSIGCPNEEGNKGAFDVKRAARDWRGYYSQSMANPRGLRGKDLRAQQDLAYRIVCELHRVGKDEDARAYAAELLSLAELFAEQPHDPTWRSSPYDLCVCAYAELQDRARAYACQAKSVAWNELYGYVADYCLLARYAILAGQVEEGIKVYEAEMERNPGDLAVYDALSSVLIDHKRDRQRAARVLLQGINAGLSTLQGLSAEEFRKRGVYLAPPGSRPPERLPYAPASIIVGKDMDAIVASRLSTGWIDVTEDIRRLEIENTTILVSAWLRRYAGLLSSAEANHLGRE